MPRDRAWKPRNYAANPTWANWHEPIFLRISAYRKEVVTNPADALSFLTNRWLGDRDEVYDAARAACSAVLRRRVSPEDARDVFRRFAQSAGLLS